MQTLLNREGACEQADAVTLGDLTREDARGGALARSGKNMPARHSTLDLIHTIIIQASAGTDARL